MRGMMLVLDNYDSFTYNLVQYLGELGTQPLVRRNNEVTLDEITSLAPERIVISPGPGRPEDAGISVGVITEYYEDLAAFREVMDTNVLAMAATFHPELSEQKTIHAEFLKHKCRSLESLSLGERIRADVSNLVC